MRSPGGQTDCDKDETKIHRVSSEPIGTADSQGGRRPRRMRGGADTPEGCDRPADNSVSVRHYCFPCIKSVSWIHGKTSKTDRR